MDDVEIAAGSAEDLFGGARVEEPGVAAVRGGAEDEHGGMVTIAEFGDALPDAAVVAHDLEEIPGHGYVSAGHLLDAPRQRGSCCAFVFGVEDLVHGDVGLYDVEDLDRVAERLSDVGAGPTPRRPTGWGQRQRRSGAVRSARAPGGEKEQLSRPSRGPEAQPPGP